MWLPTIISGVDSIGAPRRPLPVKGNPERRREQRKASKEETGKDENGPSGQRAGESDQHEGGIDELV